MDYFNLTYGFHEYPDYYGGCIIGEDGNLIVQLIRDTPEIRSLFTSVSQYNKLSFAVVTNTYYDIMHEYDYWLDLLQNNLTEDEQLKYAISQMLELYIDENNNTLTFGLVEDDPQIQSVLAKNALKPSVIRFEKSSEMVSNVTVNPGAQITVASGGYSMGFRCYYYEDGASSPTYGFVTAAHGNYLNASCSYNNTVIGYVDRRQHSGSVDASVIALYSPHSGTLTTEWGHVTFSGASYTTAIASNSVICKEGFSTHLSAGNVKSTSASAYIDGVWIYNLIKADYSAAGGDSGGIVYVPANGVFVLAGIHKAHNGQGYTFACQAQYIISALGLYLY